MAGDPYKAAKTMAENGHNLLLTGQCGTGKTHLLKKLVQDNKDKKVAVTATTGMASLQLGSAMTVHLWAGILDGRYSFDKMKELYNNDDAYSAAKKRIEETKCLIIDEISMMSAKIFEMVECVCRYLKKNDQAFGGIQIIASGDFMQLPPVPNYRLKDEGKYCFESNIFKQTFHHHINLSKVIRQHENDLITAVNELCNGTPSNETLQLMRELERPINVNNDTDVTRLYGTNFDVSYINQEMLEGLEGEMHMFKAKDEGNVKLLRGNAIPKTLTLKVGAPVILLKNIGHQLCNGLRGKVHSLTEQENPIINFNGKLVPVSPFRFDVYDVEQCKSLASRTQIPLMLAFAITVHRAQGQTIDNIEIDCHSFFAPGQMGVAIGRAKNKAGLCIRNFNISAATLKHPQCVYDFYQLKYEDPSDDLRCCKTQIITGEIREALLEEFHPVSGTCDATQEPQPSTSDDPPEPQPSISDDPPEPQPSTTHQDVIENCPWIIEDFLQENKLLCDMPTNALSPEKLKTHMNCLYSIILNITKDNPKKPQHWATAYEKLNKFLISEDHIQSIKTLFEQEILKKENNKLSSKLTFWLMDKLIQKRAEQVHIWQEEQELAQEHESQVAHISTSAKAKVRYIAGGCVSKIVKKLQQSVLNKLGQKTAKSKISRKMDYKKQEMLKSFRINEDLIQESEPSMVEIYYKQGASRGLYVVSDKVFEFFLELHCVLQSNLTVDHFHRHFDHIHLNCRSAVDNNDRLIDKWIGLFADTNETETEDEVFLNLIMELFKDITEYFIKVSISDGLQHFKATVPRKKKQALRPKITALGEKKNPKKQKLDEESTDNCAEMESEYLCYLCQQNCDWNPVDIGHESIACDKCNRWCHYNCVNITGNEAFLKRKNAKWFCPECGVKGHGKGKSQKKR